MSSKVTFFHCTTEAVQSLVLPPTAFGLLSSRLSKGALRTEEVIKTEGGREERVNPDRKEMRRKRKSETEKDAQMPESYQQEINKGDKVCEPGVILSLMRASCHHHLGYCFYIKP